MAADFATTLSQVLARVRQRQRPLELSSGVDQAWWREPQNPRSAHAIANQLTQGQAPSQLASQELLRVHVKLENMSEKQSPSQSQHSQHSQPQPQQPQQPQLAQSQPYQPKQQLQQQQQQQLEPPQPPQPQPLQSQLSQQPQRLSQRQPQQSLQPSQPQSQQSQQPQSHLSQQPSQPHQPQSQQSQQQSQLQTSAMKSEPDDGVRVKPEYSDYEDVAPNPPREGGAVAEDYVDDDEWLSRMKHQQMHRRDKPKGGTKRGRPRLGGTHKKEVLKLKVSLQVVQADTIGLTVQHVLSHTTLTSPSKPSTLAISPGTALSFSEQDMTLEELKAVEGRKTQEHVLVFVKALVQSLPSGFWHESYNMWCCALSEQARVVEGLMGYEDQSNGYLELEVCRASTEVNRLLAPSTAPQHFRHEAAHTDSWSCRRPGSDICECSTLAEFTYWDCYDVVPEALWEALRPFQRESVEFGVRHGGRVLIADEMGLGKTLQAVCLACYFHQDWPLLIVCPASLKFNWKAELLQWLPFLNDSMIHMVSSGQSGLKTSHGQTRVTIIGYELLAKYGEEVLSENFNVVICDESHYMKTPTAERTKALVPLLRQSRRVLMLSGTPALSFPIELFQQVDAILPGLFGSLEAFGYQYCGAVNGRFGMEYRGAEMLVQLHSLLKKFVMIRRLKSEALPELRPKKRTAVMANLYGHESFELCTKSEELRPLLEQLAQLRDDNEDGEIKVAGPNRARFLDLFMQTGKLKLPIVLQYIEQQLATHSQFLVFAHHRAVMDGIENRLTELGVEYIRIDGSTNPALRQERVGLFQTNTNIRVALLSLTAASTGLTLTAADSVVFAELYWTPALLLQAEDRVHRIGQSQDVLISYIIAMNTLDDLMWPVLASKLKVLGSALDGEVQTMQFAAVDDAHAPKFLTYNPTPKPS